MSLIKYSPFQSLRHRPFQHVFGDFPNHGFNGSFDKGFLSTPSVNIVEHNDAYDIEIAAPGLSKEDFNVEIQNNRLIVSVKKEESKEQEKEGRVTRREFNYQSFTKSFYLSDEVSQENISANYLNGVLKVHLAKKEEAKEIKRTIEIG